LVRWINNPQMIAALIIIWRGCRCHGSVRTWT
jgi:hypothetical protein